MRGRPIGLHRAFVYTGEGRGMRPRAHNEPHLSLNRQWRSVLRLTGRVKAASCASAVETSDASGVERFMGLFGGMGSLNDLVLDQEGIRFNALRSQARGMARSFERELGR